MNNKRLAEILRDPGIATEKEVKQIKTYSEEYSYSPFLKVLQTRLDHLHDKKDKAKSLTKAAIYIADRSILKDFITKDSLSKAALDHTSVQEKISNGKKEEKSAIDSDKKDKTKEKVKKEEPVAVKDKLKDAVEEEAAEVRSEEVAADPARKEEDKAVVTDNVELQDTETIVDKKAESDVQDGAAAVKSSNAGVELSEKQEDRSDGELEEEKEAFIEEQEKEQEPTVTEDELATGVKEQEPAVEEHEPAARVKDKEVESAAQEYELTTEKKEKEHKTDAEQKKEQEPAIVEKKKEQEPSAGKEEKEQEFSSSEQVLEQKGTEADIKKKQETPIEDPEQEHKGKSSTLSKEIMENISELKKHKASLLNLLNIGSSDKESHGDSKPKKSSKKEKSKHKAGKRDKKKGSGDHAIKSDEVSPDVSHPVKVPENKNYPNYEEEDPVVIKDFLTRLEESNPPPKKKLKKEEQEKLIEKFIQSDPQMQNVRSSKELAEKKDLSAHSVKFRDDIISENLANIMIKQGKHEKAIDIYKKLIWKFPQKKAYFATQIEELKKKLKK